MKNIIFATYDEVPGLNSEDSVLLDSLKKINITAHTASWSDPQTNWNDYDAIVIRSTWDYYKRYTEFISWLDKLESANNVVWNPISVIKWNSNKNYLRSFEKEGIKIIPTYWMDNHPESISEVLKANQWEKAVIKPTVSAGSYHTYNLTIDNHQTVLNEINNLRQTHDFMIQPFMDEIVNEGEWSLLFFNGSFSHAVLKTPKSGDFRVQPKYGSVVRSVQPSEKIIREAEQIVRHVNEPLLYARVDGVIRNNEFLLMELELIEPMLFLGYSSDAEKRFTKALAERL